uniref:Uncharacterized protein n=1 Tax=viral metagenome TaxID=1070528 RepID=A0A6H1ZGT9_9ZZZZ
MKRAIVVLLVVTCCFAAPSSCIRPPTGTVLIDTTGDGVVDSLALDIKDNATGETRSDGLPDVDASGAPLIVEGSKGAYMAGEAADQFGPTVLGVIGTAFGLPFLAAIAAVWRGSRLGRVVTNMVMSVQAARKSIAGGESGAAILAALDSALETAQSQETKDFIEKAKRELGLPSVTEAST